MRRRCLVGALRISGVRRPFEVDGHALNRAMGKVVRRGSDHQMSKRGVIREGKHEPHS